ncbi:hypothetical protein Cob_v004386 [Colletotrichum orbiculare MAFF 240422]|uniref:Uncharacterized protein n=2 Tax=Colletotrichum orbiculare species complex TaxID=2707354 RepID=N4VQQ8_COLOR|nr:hypothetical protein Cob_v004386 [Colletotrichum orbiculare MAFF 240422]TDZ30985.1 hypothetical protein C8035_v001908 [Colletotrichum spinosum]
MFKLTAIAALFAAFAVAQEPEYKYTYVDGSSDMFCNAGTAQDSEITCVFGEYVYCCTDDQVATPAFPTHRKCSKGANPCTATDPSGKVVQGIARCC